MFPACNLLTRAESPVRPACGKPDSPRFLTSNLSILENVFPIFSHFIRFSMEDLFKSPIEFMEGFEKNRVKFGSENILK
ncbi:hypothetical protein LIL_11021 [Leptospira interrogans serovar Linhai str. 56609]|nr:hypothetical protein LIL_11021 [Leptospira interrogans serovar Linhai str. 56609]